MLIAVNKQGEDDVIKTACILDPSPDMTQAPILPKPRTIICCFDGTGHTFGEVGFSFQHPRLIPVFNCQSGSNKYIFFTLRDLTNPRIPTLCASSEHLKRINQMDNLFTIKSGFLFIYVDHAFTLHCSLG